MLFWVNVYAVQRALMQLTDQHVLQVLTSDYDFVLALIFHGLWSTTTFNGSTAAEQRIFWLQALSFYR